MSNRRIVNAAFFTFSAVVFIVFNELLSQIWGIGRLPDFRIFGPIGAPMALAAAVTAITAFVIWRHERVMPFLTEVVVELKQVTWPTRQETTNHTVVVIVTVIVMALILGVFDLAWGKLAKFVLNPNL